MSEISERYYVAEISKEDRDLIGQGVKYRIYSFWPDCMLFRYSTGKFYINEDYLANMKENVAATLTYPNHPEAENVLKRLLEVYGQIEGSERIESLKSIRSEVVRFEFDIS